MGSCHIPDEELIRMILCNMKVSILAMKTVAAYTQAWLDCRDRFLVPVFMSIGPRWVAPEGMAKGKIFYGFYT